MTRFETQNAQAFCGTHTASCTSATGVQVDHLPPSSAEVKIEWSYTSAPPVRLHGVYRYSVAFLLLSSIRETEEMVSSIVLGYP